MAIKNYRDLLVWQKAHECALMVYRKTTHLPIDERYRLRDQLCRAATSIPTNIAEGMGRDSRPDFRKFLVIARGSVEETRYLLLLARDLGYVEADNHSTLEARYSEISRMLNGLLRALPV